MNRGQSGYALVAALGLTVILMLFVSLSVTASLRARTTTAREGQKTQAFYAAQTGLERAISLGTKLKNYVLPPTYTTSRQAADWLAAKITAMSGTVPGGTFTVTATVTDGATSTAPAMLTISSEGTTVGGGSTRLVRTSFPITVTKLSQDVGPLLASAPAALTITGNSGINGSAPIAGVTGAAGATHNMSCPVQFQAGATCQKSSIDPEKYTLTYTGTVPSEFKPGKILRPTTVASGQTSEERYIVEAVQGNSVKMTVLSDYIRNQTGPGQRRTFSSSGNIAMQELNNVPALMMPVDTDFSKISANVRDVCSTYECGHYTLTPDQLFRAIMGYSKDEMLAKFTAMDDTRPGSLNTSGTLNCSGPSAQWMTISGSRSTANISQCANPKLTVIDARNSTSSTLDINIPTQQSYHGLLYVIAKPGVPIKMTGNVGFAGAVIMDNGSGGLDMTGTGNFNTDCKDVQLEDGLKKTPKLCYDVDNLANIRNDYIQTYFTDTLINVEVKAARWQEVGQ